jgi:hypothetical protein
MPKLKNSHKRDLLSAVASTQRADEDGKKFAKVNPVEAAIARARAEAKIAISKARKSKDYEFVDFGEGRTCELVQNVDLTDPELSPIEIGVYKGDVRNSKMNGHGLLHFRYGELYMGALKDGMPHGFGIFHWQYDDTDDDWCIYEGEWKNGHITGYGSNTDKSGMYKGMFEMGEYHGYGVYTYANGNIFYKGEYVKGLMHGAGWWNRLACEYDRDLCEVDFHHNHVLWSDDDEEYYSKYSVEEQKLHTNEAWRDEVLVISLTQCGIHPTQNAYELPMLEVARELFR